jgi:hypothetical protein
MKHLSVHAVDEEEHAGLNGAARQPQEDVGAIFELVDELLDLRFDVVRSPYWRAVAQEAALQPAPVTVTNCGVSGKSCSRVLHSRGLFFSPFWGGEAPCCAFCTAHTP